MCFSAGASFGSAALLVSVGSVTIAANRIKSQRMLAMVPLLFGVQQAAEGIIWASMGQNVMIQQMGVMIFLTFALVVWPSWVPWSIFFVEKNETKKRILLIISCIGLGVSFAATSMLLNSDPKVYVTGHSLGYSLLNLRRSSFPPNLEFVAYVLPTLLPFFISSLRTVKIAGILLVIAVIITQIINKEASTSIWCFFAALISFYITMNVLLVQKKQIV